MRISLLHYSAPPVVGGVESVMEHHARLMADHGHQVQLIAARGAQFDERIRFLQAPLADSRHADILAVKHELDRGMVSQGFHDLTRALEAQLRPLLAGTQILIAHNVCSLNKNLPLTSALFQLSTQADFPRLIVWHHDLAWTTPRYRQELHDGPPWDLLKTAWPHARQVTVSEMRQAELAELMGIRASEITVVPNGVDVGKFLKLEALTLRYVERLKLLERGPLFLLPARITPRKNIELAMQVLAALQADLPGACLLVTGPLGPHNGANAGYLERLIGLRSQLGLAERVHFLAELSDDFIPDAVISDFYKLADALLFPSLEEGFGIPLLEAGIAGLPVFCSDIEPLQKIGGRFATYFSAQADPQVVAALVRDYFAHDKVAGLRARVRDAYTWERIYATRISPLIAS